METTAIYQAMERQLMVLQREQSFAASDLPHGGTHREQDVIRFREAIHDLMGRMEQLEKDGGRWEH